MVPERRGEGPSSPYLLRPPSVQHRTLVFWLMLKEYFLTKRGWRRRALWAIGDHPSSELLDNSSGPSQAEAPDH